MFAHCGHSTRVRTVLSSVTTQSVRTRRSRISQRLARVEKLAVKLSLAHWRNTERNTTSHAGWKQREGKGLGPRAGDHAHTCTRRRRFTRALSHGIKERVRSMRECVNVKTCTSDSRQCENSYVAMCAYNRIPFSEKRKQTYFMFKRK